MECTICFNSISDLHRACCLSCGHIFGKECIKKWLINNPKCPSCNKHSDLKDLRTLYWKSREEDSLNFELSVSVDKPGAKKLWTYNKNKLLVSTAQSLELVDLETLNSVTYMISNCRDFKSAQKNVYFTEAKHWGTLDPRFNKPNRYCMFDGAIGSSVAVKEDLVYVGANGTICVYDQRYPDRPQDIVKDELGMIPVHSLYCVSNKGVLAANFENVLFFPLSNESLGSASLAPLDCTLSGPLYSLAFDPVSCNFLASFRQQSQPSFHISANALSFTAVFSFSTPDYPRSMCRNAIFSHERLLAVVGQESTKSFNVCGPKNVFTCTSDYPFVDFCVGEQRLAALTRTKLMIFGIN